MRITSNFIFYRGLLLGIIMLLIITINAGLPKAAFAIASGFFVSPTGSGLNCTQADPCDLATALLNAQDGDQIYLAAGTYHGKGTSVVPLTMDLSLYGGWDGTGTIPLVRDAKMYPTILDGQNTRRVIDISTGATPLIDGFTLTNGYGDFSGGAVRSEYSHPTIQNCIIQDSRADGDGGAIFINGGSAEILNNQIMNNSGTWAGGLRIISDAQATVRGNYISGNTADISAGGIDIACCGGTIVKVEGNWILGNSASTFGGGIAVTGTDAMLVNNIIGENTSGEGGVVFLEGTDAYPSDINMINNTLSGLSLNDHAIWLDGFVSATLTNNILTNFASGITNNNPVSNVLSADHNLFWNTSDPIVGTNAVQADPLLDPQYHLTSDSPAINAGVNVVLSTDIDGDSRPNGTFDLGADEYFPRIFLPLTTKPAEDTQFLDSVRMLRK
jgi:hypothetical protein